jgi:hypothetical protein
LQLIKQRRSLFTLRLIFIIYSVKRKKICRDRCYCPKNRYFSDCQVRIGRIPTIIPSTIFDLLKYFQRQKFFFDRVDVNNPKRFLFYIYEQDAKSSYFRKKIVHESVVNIYENVSDQSDAIRTDSWPKLNNPSNK